MTNLLGILGAAAFGFLVVSALDTYAPRLLRRPWAHGTTVVPLLAGLLAWSGPGEPTGLAFADGVLRFGFAAAVSRLASGARRTSWLVASAITAATATAGWPAALAFALLAAAVAAVRSSTRWSSTAGAVFGGLLAQPLLRLEQPTSTGGTAFVAAAVVAVLLSSWWPQARSHERRIAIRTLWGLVILTVGGGVLAVLATTVARTDIATGIDSTQDGLAAARAGALVTAAGRFDSAALELDDGRHILTSWWASPARVVPIVGHYLEDAEALSRSASAAARSAARLARSGEDLRVVAGAINLEALDDVTDALDAATADLLVVRGQASASRSGAWIPGPAADRLDELLGSVDRALSDAATARTAALLAPRLLGVEEPRRWFVAVHSPVEQRGSGGVVSFWGDLAVDGGRIDLVDFETIGDLRADIRREATLPPDLSERLARYELQSVTETIHNVMQTPDFPLAAEAIEALVPQTGRGDVDGVLAIDPLGLTALLEVTGPVVVPSWPEAINSRNAPEILMFSQQLALEGEDRDEFLGDVAEAVFEQLTSSDLATPAELAQALQPAIAARHIVLHSSRPDEQAALVQLGAAGEMPLDDGGDFVQVVTQNSTGTKIEWFLHRTVTYDTAYDPATGHVVANLDLTLRNDAPPSGLPEVIIGGPRAGTDLPPAGFLRTWLSVYSPLELDSATIDGQPIELFREQELGWNVFADFITIPPQATMSVQLRLQGDISPGETYRLRVGTQPMAHPDELTVEFQEGDDPDIDGAIIAREPAQETVVRVVART